MNSTNDTREPHITIFHHIGSGHYADECDYCIVIGCKCVDGEIYSPSPGLTGKSTPEEQRAHIAGLHKAKKKYFTTDLIASAAIDSRHGGKATPSQ